MRALKQRIIACCFLTVASFTTHNVYGATAFWFESNFNNPQLAQADDSTLTISRWAVAPQSLPQNLIYNPASDRLLWCDLPGMKLMGLKPEPLPEVCSAKDMCEQAPSALMKRASVKVVTKVTDETAFIDHIADGCEEACLDAYWKSQPPEELKRIRCVSMDMWQPYMNSVAANLPAGKNAITHDPFHIVKNMNTAVDTVRRQEIALLPYTQGQELKGTRFMWLYGFENLPAKWNERLRALKDSQIRTARAWRLKETLRSLYQCESLIQATSFFHDRYRDAMHSKLDPVKKVAKCLKENVCGVLNYFLFHITNAYSEGINSTIQAIIKRANGYRNRERLKRDLYFHLRNLNMYPTVNL